MKKRVGILSLVTFFIPGLIFAQTVIRENLTINTYYPSPYASYNELQLFPHAAPVTACSNNNATEGTLYYNATRGIMVCVCDNANPPNCGWELLSSGYWALSQARLALYPKNMTWNVTIGNITNTFTPEAKLQVIAESNPAAGEPDRYGQFQIWGNTSASGKKLYLGIDTIDDYAGLAYVNDASGSGHWGPLALQAKDGNVGIGITTPRDKLHIIGAIRLRPLDNPAPDVHGPFFGQIVAGGNSTGSGRYLSIIAGGPDVTVGGYAEPVINPGITLSRLGRIFVETGYPYWPDTWQTTPSGVYNVVVAGKLSALGHNLWTVSIDPASCTGACPLQGYPYLWNFTANCAYHKSGQPFPRDTIFYCNAACTAFCAGIMRPECCQEPHPDDCNLPAGWPAGSMCGIGGMMYSGGTVVEVNPDYIDKGVHHGPTAGCLCYP
jgi:hypothetical protein